MKLRFLPALCLALVLPGTAPAEQAYPTVELLSTTTTAIGEPIRYPTSGPARITANIVTIAPGADSLLHRHPAPLVAYILDGEVTVDYGAAGRKVFRKGEAMVEAMALPHRGMNFGSEPVRILAIHLGAEGTANVALEDKK
ncbi:cupin domain-containing protein [Rhodocyclus purpureus]|uniref:cupin domain-containing protein n=1 Tax=Rhodocyclus purpureus TaxID=1067 RepID=UPI001913E19B|nr:cupin domain-containing protein [Rhodocyclus purpureus]MBK5913539.1 cupin [Rhodocyclus purpureus]